MLRLRCMREKCDFLARSLFLGSKNSQMTQASSGGGEKENTVNVTDKLHSMPLPEPSACEGDSSAVPTAKPTVKRKIPEEVETRWNPCGIQMLSQSLHRQLFPYSAQEEGAEAEVGQEVKEAIQKELETHGLWGRSVQTMPSIDFQLPRLQGENLDQHFQEIANRQAEPYRELLFGLVEGDIPKMPREWVFSAGWTRYESDGSWESVAHPTEDAYVLDVEVLQTGARLPTLAVAVSSAAWYSWCSSRLVEEEAVVGGLKGKVDTRRRRAALEELIPLETHSGETKPSAGSWKERVVVGHNACFDRTYIKEQYLLQGSKLRFVDTMSLHIAVSGVTSYQRALLMASRSGDQEEREREEDGNKKKSKSKQLQKASSKMRGSNNHSWQGLSSLNNLSDVYQLYCKAEPLDKEARDVFITGTLEDVRNRFQDMMMYCARDVEATYRVMAEILPSFFERFPHPVTFAGILEMSTAYLPVNSNWERYLREAEETYGDLQKELKLALMQQADQACSLLHGEKYRMDSYLHDLDWTVKELRCKKESKPEGKRRKKKAVKEEESKEEKEERKEEDEEHDLLEQFLPLYESRLRLYKKTPHMCGYPEWYRQLCPRGDRQGRLQEERLENGTEEEEEEKEGRPSLISTSMQVVPKLLRLTWNGYPLYHHPTFRWGYLVPSLQADASIPPALRDWWISQPPPLERAMEYAAKLGAEEQVQAKLVELKEKSHLLVEDRREYLRLFQEMVSSGQVHPKQRKTKSSNLKKEGYGPYADEHTPPGFDFYCLPHKDGPGNAVGNPLAKDFLHKIQDGTLQAKDGGIADRILRMSKTVSYWRNSRERILGQMVVHLEKGCLPSWVQRSAEYTGMDSGWEEEGGGVGAILPLVVVAGTLTRRAVEPTWLTASNAHLHRLGSELKAMVQAPPGCHLVGADVDSQELWIASLLGDANFCQQHGCTALGWMTLQGKKSDGSDMHSWTAQQAGVSRHQAKVLNYGRIYGAGKTFAQRLLMQFNVQLSAREAKDKAEHTYHITKGKRSFNRTLRKEEWQGGTESHMFNRLEAIACSDIPKTPFLYAHISRALQPKNVGDNFMTSRVNWVVQSSAVDYLHLLLVSMRWLMDLYHIEGRFCISIHDEVRYLVRSRDRYRAALALQITNLFTRGFCAYKLGMNDLPQSVAFFSAVDIDKVLRKEVTMDCQTPSNPHGLERGYGIPSGEALDIFQLLKVTKGDLKPKKTGK